MSLAYSHSANHFYISNFRNNLKSIFRKVFLICGTNSLIFVMRVWHFFYSPFFYADVKKNHRQILPMQTLTPSISALAIGTLRICPTFKRMQCAIMWIRCFPSRSLPFLLIGQIIKTTTKCSAQQTVFRMFLPHSHSPRMIQMILPTTRI